jgi:hypothetical protein
MSDQTDDSSQLKFIEELIDEHAEVAGDIIEVAVNTWAIHGSIAVDGDVIIAEYSTFAEAKTVLDQLAPNLDEAQQRDAR